MRVSEQVVSEVEGNAREINLLDYGEIVLTIQDGQLLRWTLKKNYKVKPKTADRKLSTIK